MERLDFGGSSSHSHSPTSIASSAHKETNPANQIQHGQHRHLLQLSQKAVY